MIEDMVRMKAMEEGATMTMTEDTLKEIETMTILLFSFSENIFSLPNLKYFL